jgi:hypothetical protein
MYVTRGFERIGNSPSSSRHTIPTASLLAELSMPIASIRFWGATEGSVEADIEKQTRGVKTRSGRVLTKLVLSKFYSFFCRAVWVWGWSTWPNQLQQHGDWDVIIGSGAV